MKNKMMNITEALDLIKDGDTLAISAAGLVCYPEFLVQELEQRYIANGAPRALTLLAGCGHSVPKMHVGSDRFAHPGFLKRIIISHPDTATNLRTMIEKNQLEAYALPQGVLNQLYRCSAAVQPGLLTKIGIGTYIDPRQDGGKLNSITKEDIVELIKLDNQEWLFYKSSPVNVAMFRGTTADENGNVTIEKEALKLEILEIALAAKARNGKVIVQVERVVEANTLNPKDVVVPAELVDAIVVADSPEQFHKQTGGTVYSPYISGELRAPRSHSIKISDTVTPADVICRRGVFELSPGKVVNIGIGIGAGVGPAAAVEGIDSEVTFTLELGVFGGTPLPPPDFGAALNPVSFVSHPTMFDFYHGGGLDITFLGAAQIDQVGNVNVSKFGNRAAGQGGFIDISQSSKKVVFCTYFMAKGFEATVKDGNLRIEQEGLISKLVNTVDQITFNGKLARESEKEVLIITERAVFKLVKDGVMLTEIAPGMDLDNDILANMDFTPLISDDLKLMDERIFRPGRMGCFDIIK